MCYAGVLTQPRACVGVHLHQGRRAAVDVADGRAARAAGGRADPHLPAGGALWREQLQLHAPQWRCVHAQVDAAQRAQLTASSRTCAWGVFSGALCKVREIQPAHTCELECFKHE